MPTPDVRTLVLAAACAFVPPAAAQEAGDLDALRRHALELVNADRAEEGLPALRPGDALDDAAQGHAADMAERGFYAHVAPDGTTPADRFRAAGGSRWALSGENIARCTGCAPPPDRARAAAFHAGWMQSPDHRENVLDPGFDRMGFGIAGTESSVYAVQTFAGPGQAGDGDVLDAAGARAAALEAVNTRRGDLELGPLEPDAALDAVAEGVLDARLSGEPLPEDLFGLLPEGAGGWTGLEVRSASRGGAGGAMSAEVVRGFVETWDGADGTGPLGAEDAGHLGFAAAARDDGRAIAVAVFGTRG